MSKYLLPAAIIAALRTSVETHGGKIGSGRLFEYGSKGNPHCILGHAGVADGIVFPELDRIVYDDADDHTPPTTPVLSALKQAGIWFRENDDAIGSIGRVTFDEWLAALDVGVAEEVAYA